MRFYITHETEEALKLAVSGADQAELEGLMRRFFLDRLNRPLKSQIFMDRVAKSLQSISKTARV